jgi:hypothetical protein
MIQVDEQGRAVLDWAEAIELAPEVETYFGALATVETGWKLFDALNQALQPHDLRVYGYVPAQDKHWFLVEEIPA